MEMRSIENPEIKKIIIHILDKNSDEPLFNEKELELETPICEFVSEHIIKGLYDEDNKKAKFYSNTGIVKAATDSIIDGGNFIEESKKIAQMLFSVIKSNGAIPSCDLIVVEFEADDENFVGILKMDYQSTVGHDIEFEGENFNIKVVFEETSLPSTKQKIPCFAYVKKCDPDYYDMIIKDKPARSIEGENIEYFAKDFLGVNRVVDDLDKTKIFKKSMESWIRKNTKNDIATAIDMRNEVNDILINAVDVNFKSVADSIIEEDDKKEKFIQKLEESGIETAEPFELNKQWIEKKMKMKQIKTDSGFTIKGEFDLFDDKERFEIRHNEDGSVNYTIKNVRNFSER